MRVPFSFLTTQFADAEPIFNKIREFLKRCDFTLGEDLQVFEKKYANFCGVKHAIGVGSGTDAISLSLKCAGVLPGDEVITAPNSFIATTGAIVQAGARPIYVDVAGDLNIDAEKIQKAITEKTTAIVPVHWAGAACDMDTILRIAEQYKLIVIEDACQALGAQWNNKSVGSFGLSGAFSTHPLKPLHVWGDGGVIVTNSDDMNDKLRLIRNHGLQGRDEVACYGVNSRFDNLHAIVGNVVFDTLTDTIEKRIHHAKTFDDAFNRGKLSNFIKIPARINQAKHVYHLYMIEVSQRQTLLSHLQNKGIEAKVHYPIPLHLQPAAKQFGYQKGMFPNTERQSDSFLTLPCHQYLSDEQVKYTIDVISKFYGV